MQETSPKRILLWLGLVALLVLLWFLFAGKVDEQESSMMVVTVTLAVVAMIRAGVHNFAPFGPRASWLRHLVTLPYQVLRDSVTVISALLATLLGRDPGRGKFSTGHFKAGGDDPVSTAKRALAVGMTTFPPNSIVVEINEEKDTFLYHELVPQGKAPEPAKSLGESE